MPDPVEETATLERVVQLARPVRGEHDAGAPARAHRSELGNRDLEVREHLEEKCLELLVGAVDLVDQEDDRLVRLERLEQRPADQELAPEELGVGDRAFLRCTDVEELARVVPLVDRVGDIEALVALEADQPRTAGAGERLGCLGLAHPGLALEQHRLLEREREEERGRESPLGQVRRLPKSRLELVDRGECVHGFKSRAGRIHSGATLDRKVIDDCVLP